MRLLQPVISVDLEVKQVEMSGKADKLGPFLRILTSNFSEFSCLIHAFASEHLWNHMFV